MNPAYSVILFTTASGAGYGLLAWLAISAVFGEAARNGTLGLIGVALALALITAGLLSSTLHLGRPERAWRAFSQWRTSWLSREGVLAVATFLPAGVFGLLWVFGDRDTGGVFTLAAIGSIIGALATVYATGMIYQSLPTIRAWGDVLVAPNYVVLALASGAVLAFAMHGIFGEEQSLIGGGAIVLLAVAAVLKQAYWVRIDRAPRTWTAGNATGLGRFGKVRVLEQPHGQANFVMREMGYRVARKHAERLRLMTLALAFAMPALLILVAMASGPVLATLASLSAVVAMAVGLLTERWLFFAEAQHVVTTFYGAERA